MGDGPDDRVLTWLRRLDIKVDALKIDMAEVKESLGLIEAQYSSLSRRVDRVAGDLERVTARLSPEGAWRVSGGRAG